MGQDAAVAPDRLVDLEQGDAARGPGQPGAPPFPLLGGHNARPGERPDDAPDDDRVRANARRQFLRAHILGAPRLPVGKGGRRVHGDGEAAIGDHGLYRRAEWQHYLLQWRRDKIRDSLATHSWCIFRYVALQTVSAQHAWFPISDAGRDKIIYGDVAGAILAALAIVALRRRARWAIPLVCLLVCLITGATEGVGNPVR